MERRFPILSTCKGHKFIPQSINALSSCFVSCSFIEARTFKQEEKLCHSKPTAKCDRRLYTIVFISLPIEQITEN